MDNFWSELMETAQKVRQKLQQNGSPIQVMITANQVSFTEQENSQLKTNNQKLTTIIQQVFDVETVKHFENGNVIEEIRHYWRSTRNHNRRSQVKNIELHFQIGASLHRHCQRMEQLGILENRKEESFSTLQEAIRVGDIKVLYKVCARLYNLFEHCPQVVPYLDDCLSVTRIGRMKNNRFDELKQTVDELIEQLSQ
jgi:hypothetical protein